MASLREKKDRMNSVRGTLKITSAMKLVASSKLRKAQAAVEALRPYEQVLTDILASVCRAPSPPPAPDGRVSEAPVALVCFSSNNALCGGFNAGVIREARAFLARQQGPVEVHACGRKIAEALRRTGVRLRQEDPALAAHPHFRGAAELARELAERVRKGELSQVYLLYNHFVTTARQEIRLERYLPLAGVPEQASGTEAYLVEPSVADVAKRLLPQVENLKLYAALLDSSAAEQAARTLAMQAASDNARKMLSELTLAYNKGRQQKITAEILAL